MAQKRKHHTKRTKRHTTVGRIFPPIDVRNTNLIKEAIKRITAGPITIIVFYADWCGACKDLKPHFDAAARTPGRSIQAVKVNEAMIGPVNDAIQSMNSSASPLPVDAYPSVFLLDNKGNNITKINHVNDTKVMSKLMKESGQSAEAVALNSPKPPSGSYAPRSLSLLGNQAPQKRIQDRRDTPRFTDSLPPVIVSTRNESNGSAEEVAASFSEPSDVAASLVEPPGVMPVTDRERSVPGAVGGGGSLYSALASSTYKLAPAAVLLGLAAATTRRRRGKKTLRKRRR